MPAGSEVAEAVPESIKNMLLVMTTSGILKPPGQEPQQHPHVQGLWSLTYSRLEEFLPGLFYEVQQGVAGVSPPPPAKLSGGASMADYPALGGAVVMPAQADGAQGSPYVLSRSSDMGFIDQSGLGPAGPNGPESPRYIQLLESPFAQPALPNPVTPGGPPSSESDQPLQLHSTPISI